MLGNIQIVLPVFVLIAAGYFATKTKAFSSEHADIVMTFSQKFGLPALLFTAVAKLDLPTVFQPELLISFYTGSTFVFIAAALIARYIFKRPPGTSVAVGFTGMFSNTVLLSIPIIERAYGSDTLQPVYAIIAIHAPYGYLLGITTMEIVRSGGQPIGTTLLRILKEISSNALTIGIILGFIVNLSGITLPQFIWSPIQMMVSAAIPSALFSLGAILVRYKLADRVGETIMVLFLKLLIHPGITFILATSIFHLSHEFTRAAVVAAAMAPGVNVYLFANIYDRAKGTAANAVLLGTSASVLSVSLWLYVLEVFL